MKHCEIKERARSLQKRWFPRQRGVTDDTYINLKKSFFQINATIKTEWVITWERAAADVSLVCHWKGEAVKVSVHAGCLLVTFPVNLLMNNQMWFRSLWKVQNRQTPQNSIVVLSDENYSSVRNAAASLCCWIDPDKHSIKTVIPNTHPILNTSTNSHLVSAKRRNDNGSNSWTHTDVSSVFASKASDQFKIAVEISERRCPWVLLAGSA